MSVDPKKLKRILYIKRDGKLTVNEKLIDQYRGKPLKRKPSDITSKTTSDDFNNAYRSRGHRIGLNIDPFKMALIRQLNRLGLKYKYTDKDFLTDKWLST